MTVGKPKVLEALLMNEKQDSVYLALEQFSKEISLEHRIHGDDYIRGALTQIMFYALRHSEVDALDKAFEDVWVEVDRQYIDMDVDSPDSEGAPYDALH